MWMTMAPPRRVELTPHTFIGVSLAVLGVVLTLDNLGFVDAHAVFRFWPLVPILVGTVYIVQGRELRDWLIGGAWMTVGTAFLLRNLDVFDFRLTDFLPLILVALGLKFMFGRRGDRQRRQAPGMPGAGDMPIPPPPPHFDPSAPGGWHGTPGASAAAHPWPGFAPGQATGAGGGPIVRVFAMLWGADRRVRGPVSHVEVSAVMGGCDVDLRDAVPSAEPIVIQVFAMWGGIDIRVPSGWLIQNEAWPILGGIVDSTTPPALPTHRVILRGNAFMGGVELKN
jgi:hypothetical protein